MLCGKSGCLHVGLGLSVVVDEPSAVCNDSNESAKPGKPLCDVFFSMDECNMYISNFQVVCGSVELCGRPA
jgi:hypothetical protein